MNETLNTLIDNYIAAWNETDATKRQEIIAEVWTPHATYLDPLMQGTGHEAIDALIQGVHTQFPGHRFERTGQANAVGSSLRFSWHLAAAGQPHVPVVGGTDFCTLSADGRLQSVTGFLDFAPEQSA